MVAPSIICELFERKYTLNLCYTKLYILKWMPELVLGAMEIEIQATVYMAPIQTTFH